MSGGSASAATASDAETVEIGAGAGRAFSSAAVSQCGECVADARPGEPRRSFENVRRTITPSSSSGTAVSRLYS